jgi:hypothetical protein
MLDHIFRHLARDELHRVLQVNQYFYSVSARILYQSIVDLPPRRSVAVLNTLCQNGVNASLVRHFAVNFSNCNIIGNAIYRLLHRALQRLTGLVSLSIMQGHGHHCHSLAWIFEKCSFRLRHFETSMLCDESLARFLDAQSSITELCLGGFQEHVPFSIVPSSLPQLFQFRAVPSIPSFLAEVIRGRPVECVSLTLSREAGPSTLDSLHLSSKPIWRLSVLFLDETIDPSFLLTEISQRFPELKELHIFSTSTFTLVWHLRFYRTPWFYSYSIRLCRTHLRIQAGCFVASSRCAL